VVLGVSGLKLAEGVLGTLAGVSLEQPIWDRGWRCTPQCVPTCTVFEAQVLGFYLRMEDMSLPPSEREWINLSIGLSYTPPRREGGQGQQDSGVSVGERWE
jgi:hypothetical protein